MALEGFRSKFSKLGLATKMALQDDSSNFFHFERIEIDEKNIMIQYGSYLSI
jgi:hypothetical protein